MDVGLGVDLVPRELAGRGPVGIAPPPAPRTASVRSSTTGVGPTETYAARAALDRAVLPQRHHRGEPADRVVAVPAGHLDERRARVPAASAGKRADTASSPGSTADSSGPRKNSSAPTVRVGPAAPASTVPPEQGEHRRHLPARVGVREAADRRAAVADHRVRDEPQRLPEQRQRVERRVVALDVGVPGQRTDAHPAVLDADVRQLGDAG